MSRRHNGPGHVLRHHLRRTLIIGIILLPLVVIGQRRALDKAVTTVEPEAYARAVDLTTDRHSHWRYGYLRGQHGAFLVRTDKFNYNRSHLVPGDSEVTAAMEAHFRSLTKKAVLEGILYWSIAMGITALLGLRLLGSVRARRLIIVTASAVVFLVMVSALLLPFTSSGYGAPLFSTWDGPGAGSYSSSLSYYSSGPGMTVSYRFIVERVIYLPLGFINSLDRHLPLVIDTTRELLPESLHFRPTSMFSVRLFYFLLGAFAGCLLSIGSTKEQRPPTSGS